MKILNDRNIQSSQKGFENVAEGTKYDDYHVDTKGQGILSVENIIDEIEGRGNQAVLTIQTSDGATNHSQFTAESWNEYKDSVNDGGKGAAITDVWITEVEGGSYVRNSRRPVKSSRKITSAQEPLYWGDEHDYRGINMYTREEYIEKYGEEPPEWKRVTETETDLWNSRRPLKSARFLAEDDDGNILAEADSYEEAQSVEGCTKVVDTESQEGQEEMGSVFQSRKITSAVDGGWEVRSSDVPKALDLFVEYFGEEDALEQIAKAMGDATLEENIDWIAQQWGFAEDIEELDNAWDKYETAKEIMGESELFNNLTQAAGYDELAEDLAFIFRMNDFREWDEVSGYDDEDEDYDDEEITEQNEIDEVLDWCWDVLNKRPENHFGSCTEDEAKDLAKMYKEQGGTFSRIDEFVYIDNEDILQKIADNYFTEEDDDFEEDDEITNSHLFPVKTVKNILSGKWSEDYAAECIAQKQDINVGYAKQILSSWIEQYKPRLIKSGVEDETDTLNQEFDVDGDLESWAEQYATDGSKSDSVGGEIARAAMQIINRYNGDGDMIGRGYGNESVNPAARYLIEKAEMGVNEQIQNWLNHEERADDYEYDSFLGNLRSEVESILRENPELFQKPNSDDYWSWKTDDDLEYSFDRCYIDDGEGTQYWFEKGSDDRWTCTEIETNPNRTYSEGDTISDGDEFIEEIDPTEEFGSFEAEGLIYEYAGDEWDDDLEQYTSWQITKVIPNNPYCDEGDTFDYYELEPDSILGYTLYDDDGVEIDERTFLANSLIKSAFFAGDEGEVIIEINNNGKWEFVSLDNTPEGWSTKKNAKVFKSEDAARSSALMKRLEQAGYSEDVGNLRISVR